MWNKVYFIHPKEMYYKKLSFVDLLFCNAYLNYLMVGEMSE